MLRAASNVTRDWEVTRGRVFNNFPSMHKLERLKKKKRRSRELKAAISFVFVPTHDSCFCNKQQQCIFLWHNAIIRLRFLKNTGSYCKDLRHYEKKDLVKRKSGVKSMKGFMFTKIKQ